MYQHPSELVPPLAELVSPLAELALAPDQSAQHLQQSVTVEFITIRH
jgi:hypothetical protein